MTRHPCCEVGRRDVDRKAYVRQQVFIEGQIVGPGERKDVVNDKVKVVSRF